MKNSEDITMVAPCGINCADCECATAKDNPKLMDYLVSRGIPRDRLPCPGCRLIKGNCVALGCTCDTYTCVKEHQVDFCYECGEFPCSKLTPAADRANILPHNMKVYNLCCIQRKGLQSFLDNYAIEKKRYYQGKMIVGAGPQLEEK